MDPKDLKRAINESRTKGFIPFFVNATAGTTVLGSIDPLEEIAKICGDEDLWLHVDVRYFKFYLFRNAKLETNNSELIF